MLTYERSGPETVSDGATVLVLLHGRGSDRADLQGLRPMLPGDWTLLTPQAPFRGEPWGYGPGWAWYQHVAADRLNEPSLEESLTELDAFMSALPDLLEAHPRRVVLGGFSQGGTVSMAYALNHRAKVAAVLNFSGFLAEARIVRVGLTLGGPPMFWGHGLHDPAIPHTLAVSGRARLAAARVRVEGRDYKMGHMLQAGEVADALTFLRSL